MERTVQPLVTAGRRRERSSWIANFGVRIAAGLLQRVGVVVAVIIVWRLKIVINELRLLLGKAGSFFVGAIDQDLSY